MKKKFFLIVLLVLSSFQVLYSQWVNEETDLTAISTNIEQFKNAGGTQTVYQSSSYAIGRKKNTDNSSFISRSYHQFNLTGFPSNTQIDEVTVHYVTSAGTYSFKLTKVSSIGSDIGANWSAIGSGTSMAAGIAYSAVENSFISTQIKTEMQNLLAGGNIILGALSENETANDSYSDLFIWLHIKYRRPSQSLPYIARNYYKGQNGVGQIGVGLGVTPSSYPSPKEFSAIENQNINLLAYDNQDISTRQYLFNDTEAPLEKSKWEQDLYQVYSDLGITQSITVVASSTNAGASFRTWLKQNCKIDQTHKTEFDGDQTQQNTSWIVENNNGSITAPSPKTIGSNNYNFAGWVDNLTLPQTRTINSPTDNQTYSAFYKVPHKSNQTNAYSNSSQRRFIQTPDGVKHICYESMYKVWYELSTDGGTTWILGNGGKPLSSADAKNPSMSFYANTIGIVWQEKSGSSSNIKFAVFYSANYATSIFYTVVSNDCGYTSNANPVVGWGYNGKAVIVWSGLDYCENPFGGTALKYWYGNATSNGISLISQCAILGTDANSINPTITSDYTIYSSPFYYHFAWQQVVNPSTFKINYCKLYASGNNLTNTTFEEASLNSGYSKNYNPVIVLKKIGSGEYIYVTWLGNRTIPTTETRVLLKYKLSSTWSVIGVYGTSPVQNFSVNKGTTIINNQEPMALCWSEPNGALFYNKLMKSPGSGILPLSSTGKDMQINNGTTFSSMFANSFSSVSLPYSFNFSQNFGAIGKENSLSIFNGREGVVGKNGAQFFFALGDISVNGQNINFISIPDTVSVNSMSLLNTYFESEPFTVNSGSNLIYGVQYGITDSVLCSSALTENENIGFKVELMDATTNEILGVFDEVTYTTQNVFQYNNIGYQVNLSGIGERTVKFRLVTNTNAVVSFGLANRFADQSTLAKNQYQRINYQGNLAVTDYALEQNYPNPFNPSTTIKFQLPKDGMVTLKVYDILGNEVTTLINEEKTQGRYEVNFNASSLASGVYFYQIKAGEFIQSKKMILLK